MFKGAAREGANGTPPLRRYHVPPFLAFQQVFHVFSTVLAVLFTCRPSTEELDRSFWRRPKESHRAVIGLLLREASNPDMDTRAKLGCRADVTRARIRQFDPARVLGVKMILGVPFKPRRDERVIWRKLVLKNPLV